MKIGVLTSSRADFGIYLPLLSKLKADNSYQLEIIAFGTHLSRFHGYTLNFIEREGFDTIHKISTILTNDDEHSISTAFGLTALKFSDFWSDHNYDIVFCLGDRFEMCAAVQAAIPFGVRFSHLHGGETTLGAIDNIYRHQISLASTYHFTATKEFSERVEEITGQRDHIYNVGSLSLDGIENISFLSEIEFREKYNITGDFGLVTFHPETISSSQNVEYVKEMKAGLSKVLDLVGLVITMPNADTLGTVYRDALQQLQKVYPSRVILIENFGKMNYFAAMHYSRFLLGNTSSGIIEAASFRKYVVNVGDRQKGRAQSMNLINCKFLANEIFESSKQALALGDYLGNNVYYQSGTADKIIEVLNKLSYA